MKKYTPSIIDLALQYGTITREQFEQVSAISGKDNDAIGQEQLQFLFSKKWVTQYQIELLVLLRNYYVVRRAGENFGRMVLEKGFASEKDIERARRFQKEEFKKLRTGKLIGEILLEQGIITREQRDSILQEQALLAKESQKILGTDAESEEATPADKKASANPDTSFSEFSPAPDGEQDLYQTQFLQNKTLDQDFVARLLEKGFATREQMAKARKALLHQRAGSNQIRFLDQIMVDMGLISNEQRKLIKEEGVAVRKENRQSVAIDIFREDMAAKVTISDVLLNEISSYEYCDILNILNRIREIAAKENIVQGIVKDSLLFCHLKNCSQPFLFACQDIPNNHSVSFLPDCASGHNMEGFGSEDSVQKGKLLVTWDTKSPFKGIDIFGNEFEGAMDAGKCFFPLCPGHGSKITSDHSGLIADRSGRPYLDFDGKVFVCPPLHLLEDMDQKYGAAPDRYSDLFVSGTITGAYPVTAGNIQAREIRGAEIDALGDIQVEDGITDSIIRTRGSIHATYLHNCQIQAFGDICVGNEILDCRIESSGKLLSPFCRVLSSFLFVRRGIFVREIGSERSPACVVCAGSEDHLVSCLQGLQEKINGFEHQLAQIKSHIKRLSLVSEKTFQKMQDVKRFHDAARQKKKRVEAGFTGQGESMSLEQQEKTEKLIEKFEERMEQALTIIRDLNPAKKKIDKQLEKLHQKFAKTKMELLPRIDDLTREMVSLCQWSKENENVCEIQCSGRALKGTVLKGIYSEIMLEENMEDFICLEEPVEPLGQTPGAGDDVIDLPLYNLRFSSAASFEKTEQ